MTADVVVVTFNGGEVLASCLERLLRNPELCRRMGDAGRRHVEEHFDIKRQSKELEKIYNEVLARHFGSGAETVTLGKARI